jgi:hypothetical protein
MADLGRIRFFNARVGTDGKRIEIPQLGSGTFDHIALYGPNGATTSAVEIGSWQDTSVNADSTGAPLTGHLGQDLSFGGSGYCTNNKRISASGVQISGLPEGPYVAFLRDVNVFDPANLGLAPDFVHRNSGTLLITYVASGSALVNTFNAKAFAFDATGAITDAPPDVTVAGYEINASGQWFDPTVSGVWQTTAGRDTPIFFTNHSSANSWVPANEHYFVLGLSAKADSVGILDDWDLAFQVQFA